MADNPRPKYLIPLAIIVVLAISAIIVLAAGSYLPGKTNQANAQTLNLNKLNTNASYNANALQLIANENVSPTNLNTNSQPVNRNVNSTVNGNVNSNTNSANLACQPVSRIIENAAQSNNQTVCLLGYYQISFEFSALAAAFRTTNGSDNLAAPYVWVEGTVPEALLDCRTSAVGQNICFGQIKLTGKFEYTTSDPGFGHLGNYQYQLSNVTASSPSQLPD